MEGICHFVYEKEYENYWSMHSALGQDMVLTCFDHLVPMWVTYGTHIDEPYGFTN